MNLCVRVPAALVAGALLATVPVVAAPAGAAQVQAVVTWEDGPVAVPGVRVVQALPALGAAVVRGDGAALARLGRADGVRGVAPDGPVTVTRRRTDSGGGVRASEGLGGGAGSAGAGRGVRVAVVDTGVSDTPFLSRAGGRLVDAVDTSTGAPRTSGVFDDGYGHGTFMAGVVAGGATRDVPAIGVAPGATVLVVRVADAQGRTSLSRVLAGLDWIAAHPDRVDVVTLALSAERPGPGYGADPLTDAVERVREAGVTPVVSAGNDPDQVGNPGFDPRVVSVGAADLPAERVASFSGSGVVAGVQRPDVVASGVDVLGVVPASSVIGRSVTPRPDGLVRGSGSSQATAVTSGVAALLLAQHPQATPTQVKASLRAAAVDLAGERDGEGLVRVPQRLRGSADGSDPAGDAELTGEADFDASSWSASSWSASSWSASSWSASSWSASSWSASSWSASSWSASSWSASSWSSAGWGGAP